MGHGGKRPGAGRKKGAKAKLLKDPLGVVPSVDQIVAGGLTPLEFLIQTMNDPAADPDVRVKCARAAAPYIHRKRPLEQQITATMPTEIRIVTPLTDRDDEEE